jgi:ABC-type microcin C transport system permease subunit YejB
LEVVLPGHIIGTLGFALYGWSVHYGWHLAVPEIALFLIGFGVSTAFNTSNTLLIDLHRDQPATATAATNLVRCLMSAAGAAAILPMCEVMGIGWAFMCVAGLYAIMILLLFLIMARGMRWRRVVEECV